MRSISTGWLATALLVAMIPSVSYMGHWEPRFEIPLTDYYWGFPESRQSAHPDHESSHAQHCHGDSSCSDSPTTVGATVAMLRDEVALLGLSAFIAIVVGASWEPLGRHQQRPETPPPKGLARA